MRQVKKHNGKRSAELGLTAQRPPMYCFETPELHRKHILMDVLPCAGPMYVVMSVVRRAFGRRAGAVRNLQRKHLLLESGEPKIFLIGQKRHRGEWRNLSIAPDLLAMFRAATSSGGINYITTAMKHGVRHASE